VSRKSVALNILGSPKWEVTKFPTKASQTDVFAVGEEHPLMQSRLKPLGAILCLVVALVVVEDHWKPHGHALLRKMAGQLVVAAVVVEGHLGKRYRAMPPSKASAMAAALGAVLEHSQAHQVRSC